MLYRAPFRSKHLHVTKLGNQYRGAQNAIVVALDGEAAAEKALPHAVHLAGRWEAPLHLVHIVTPSQYWDGSESAVFFNREWLSAREQAEAYLESVSEAIAAANDIPVTAEITANISVESGLTSLSAGRARLLIAAKPPRSGFSQIYSGSVTNSLVGQLSVPLLIVPAVSSGDSSERTDYQRILVSVGHDDVSESLLGAAAEFAQGGAACHLLHVFPLRAEHAVTRAGRFLPINLRQEAAVRLHRAESWLQRQNVNATPHQVDDWRHSPAQSIVAQSESLDADLIVLGARRHFLPWWLRGGVPEYVARHAKIPVLIVPSDYQYPLVKKENHVDFHSN